MCISRLTPGTDVSSQSNETDGRRSCIVLLICRKFKTKMQLVICGLKTCPKTTICTRPAFTHSLTEIDNDGSKLFQVSTQLFVNRKVICCTHIDIFYWCAVAVCAVHISAYNFTFVLAVAAVIVAACIWWIYRVDAYFLKTTWTLEMSTHTITQIRTSYSCIAHQTVFALALYGGRYGAWNRSRHNRKGKDL